MKKIKFLSYDRILLVVLCVILIFHYVKLFASNLDETVLIFFASVATLPVLLSALRSLKDRKITVDLLASIALLVSLLNREWASATFINLMLTSARIFNDYTDNKSRSAIKSLFKLKPQKVKIKEGREIIEKPISQVKKNDLVVIELGDRIPVDGVVKSGQAMLDQSSLTGESFPVSKSAGDKVLSSTLNVSGSLIIKAEHVGKDTTFEKMIKLVEESQKNKVGILTMVDRFTTIYIILTLVGAATLYVITQKMSLVLSVLLVTCADDIAVAVPMAFSAAIGNAAKKGIIIKGAAYLEGLTKIKTIFFDKTGTLTKGKMRVVKIVPLGKCSQSEILKLACTGEYYSNHPIAKAMVNFSQEKKIKFNKPSNFKEFPGKGSICSLKGQKIICGRMSFLADNGVHPSLEQKTKILKARKEGFSILLVSYKSEITGYIKFEDELRPEVKDSIQKLKELGVSDLIVLTGDNEKVAQKVVQETNIEKFYANLLPENKLDYIQKSLNKEHKVAMVGDGVNDAASLALADVGIAMGVVGSDAAIEAADVALMKDDISKIPEAIEIGKYVMKVARQDFWIWGIINLIGLSLAVSGTVGPEGAASFNFITDFIPILNSLRLFQKTEFSLSLPNRAQYDTN